jgi:hypothetical protein
VDLSKYQELSGLSVPAGKTAYMNAQLKRIQGQLEIQLGYTLTPDNVKLNIYNELGKTTHETACPDVDTLTLDPADDVVDAYRIFDYNELDRYFLIDPFKKVNKVKLVFLKQGGGTNGVTVKTFDETHLKEQYSNDGFGKYLERQNDWIFSLRCPYGSYQLAVDAEWLWDTDNDVIPDDLLYVWADMVTYYSDPKRFIQLERVTSHEYRKFERKAPETEPNNLAILKKYAGPYGSLSNQPTTGARPNWNSMPFLPLGSEGFNVIL